MIDFLLEVTGIKRLHDRWVVKQILKRADEEERLFQENLKNLWQQPVVRRAPIPEDDNEG